MTTTRRYTPEKEAHRRRTLSTKDKQFVQSLAEELKREQIEPWLCEVDIEFGDNLGL